MKEKNIKITNLDNGSVIIVNKDTFNSMRTCLSENSIYQETDEEETIVKVKKENGTKDTYYNMLNIFKSMNLKDK
jgi:hypothetical protein